MFHFIYRHIFKAFSYSQWYIYFMTELATCDNSEFIWFIKLSTPFDTGSLLYWDFIVLKSPQTLICDQRKEVSLQKPGFRIPHPVPRPTRFIKESYIFYWFTRELWLDSACSAPGTSNFILPVLTHVILGTGPHQILLFLFYQQRQSRGSVSISLSIHFFFFF